MNPLTAFLNWLREYRKKRQEDKKYEELYARLDRNAAGKFSKKQYIQHIKKVQKAEKTRK